MTYKLIKKTTLQTTRCPTPLAMAPAVSGAARSGRRPEKSRLWVDIDDSLVREASQLSGFFPVGQRPRVMRRPPGPVRARIQWMCASRRPGLTMACDAITPSDSPAPDLSPLFSLLRVSISNCLLQALPPRTEHTHKLSARLRRNCGGHPHRHHSTAVRLSWPRLRARAPRTGSRSTRRAS